ncbi:MAG: putative TetR-family transcriptional regulator [Actinomycetia bacterium]|nr:putative TetR-family transcriptional regulator [Actinomycetes bacterium]
MATETDPRVERTRASIREALVALVEEEGLPALTHQRVAERAGIGRATIYRHCPTVEALVNEAMDCMDVALPPADDDTFESQLVAIGRKFARDANDPATAALLLGMMERAQHDPESRARQGVMVGRMVDLLQPMAEGHDVALVVAQVIGPLLFKALVVGERVEEDFVVEVVRRALV